MIRAHEHLRSELTAAATSFGIESPKIVLEKPRDPSHGDVASNTAMLYGKKLGKNPKEFAVEIADRLKLNSNLVAFGGVAGPGFMNFRFAPAYLQSLVGLALSNSEQFGCSSERSGEKVLIEFVSANPSGPLNVVSARAAAVGDTLLRLFRCQGAHCEGEFYVNDAGNQVELLGRSVYARYQSAQGKDADIPEGGYHGQYLIDYAAELVKQFGDRFLNMDSEQAARELGRMAIEHHVELHQRTLKQFRVGMDHWFRESKLRDQRLEYAALDELEKLGAVYKKDGATFIKTSEFGDQQDWVIVTSDGRPTYFLPDIAYHLDKFRRGYDTIIDILGPDHHAYLTKMAAALRASGENADKLEIHLLQHINLLRDGEPVKMSKRAGQIVEMDELLDEVGVDAARYFFLLRRTSTPLDFDIELAKRKSEDNPVFYVQYAHARIASIFRKADFQLKGATPDVSLLEHEEELNLLRRIREFHDVIAETTMVRDPHAITVWLREVAAQFHKFYHHCRVITEPQELSIARLCLCGATQVALRRGLDLCGVSAPEEM